MITVLSSPSASAPIKTVLPKSAPGFPYLTVSDAGGGVGVTGAPPCPAAYGEAAALPGTTPPGACAADGTGADGGIGIAGAAGGTADGIGGTGAPAGCGGLGGTGDPADCGGIGGAICPGIANPDPFFCVSFFSFFGFSFFSFFFGSF